MLSALQTQFQSHFQDARQWVLDHPRVAVSSAAALLGCAYLASPRKRANLPPGPKPLPIIGSRHLLDYNKIHESLNEMGKHYGDVFTVYVFSEPIIILNSYEAIRDGFSKDRYMFAGRPNAEDYLACMNEEVFMSVFTDQWKKAKKFGISAIKTVGGPKSDAEAIMQKEIAYLLDTLGQSAGQPATSQYLMDVLYKATGNVMSNLTFGIHYDDHDDPELKNFCHGIEEWYWYINTSFPWDGFDPAWLVRLNFGPHRERFRIGCAKMREHCKAVMTSMTSPHPDDPPRTLLEYFWATRDMDVMGGIDGFADTICLYTVDQVDTMSVIAQWAILYLAYFPDVQKQLQSRIDEVVGRGQRVTVADRGDLGLVDSFLHELQRHSNVTCVTFPHTATRDSTFRGYDVPKGTLVYANYYAVQMDPEIHPEPEKFKVDRFMDENGKFQRADTVYGFSAGARQCPGDNHSRLELYLIVANLLHRFRLAFPSGSPPPPLRMQDKYFFKIPYEFQVVFTER